MKINKSVPKWKFLVYPFISFIIVFAISRSLFPLIKDWTWLSTACGFVCGLIVAVIEVLKLLFSKED